MLNFRKLTVVCAVFLFSTNVLHAKNISDNSYSQVSDNPSIIAALNIMKGTTAEWAKDTILGNNVSGRPMKVYFKNLAELSARYADFDALGWKDGKQLYIFINNKHKTAPPEALASLLSHESVHQDETCSLEEETYAWGYEADVWIQMKKKNHRLNEIPNNRYPLVDRLNTLGRLFETAGYNTDKIRNVVYTNPGYSGLPVHSPGF